MYLIKVISTGSYKNVVPGYRLCFFKRNAISTVKLFLECGCDIKIYKAHKLDFCTYGFTQLRKAR